MPILVENLTHTYVSGAQTYAAIKDVSFEVEDGEFLGIIGHTGSGKSTLVQHLNGLLQPNAGRVVVNGVDLAQKKTRKQVRSQVGMVFQYPEHQLFEETVYKDVAFGPKNMGVAEAELENRVLTALEKVGLDSGTIREKSPFELSGGQKRRVALAGILAMEPAILVLDEPMAGLDPQGRKEILGLVRGFHQNGMTIVMVSHSMDDIAALADRVLVMNGGQLFAIGPAAEIFARAEELMAIGLGVPQSAFMAAMLRKRGVEVPRQAHTAPALMEYILSAWRKGEAQ